MDEALVLIDGFKGTKLNVGSDNKPFSTSPHPQKIYYFSTYLESKTMKTIITKSIALLVSITALTLNSFGQNALDFDGINDYATAANASAHIANQSNFSMAFWVFPKNAPAGFPNFDGFAGFRNDLNADFYILQLSANNVEARFRNSIGTNYTITGVNAINLNQWNHYALTYNGSQLKLYQNGSLVNSISASGSITNSNVPFNIGYTPFTGNNFYTQGTFDDVTLWDKTLSAAEITTIYNSTCGINTSDPNLKLCYEFNQGVAGGANSGITSFIDTKGNINATPQNMAMSGSTSNLVSGFSSSTSSSFTFTTCQPFILPSGTDTILDSGTYTDTLTNANGCDSIITYNVTVDSVDVSVTASATTLTANATGVYYQWIRCSDYSIVTNATYKTFSPPDTSQYAVIISNANCADTSECISKVSNIGLSEISGSERVSVFPNPVEDEINVSLGENQKKIVLDIYTTSGQLVDHQIFENTKDLKVSFDQKPGIYLMKISSDSSSYWARFVKN